MSDVTPPKATLLPVNSTRLERALAVMIHRRMDAIPVPIRDLWDAQKCPAHLLGWLAWSLSVDVWDEDWEEEQKRAAIAAAFFIHVHKGTVGAVRRALAALNIGAQITEWWEDGSPRGTFKITAFAEQIFDGGGAINARFLANVSAVVNRSNRASQHFTLRVGENFKVQQPLRTAARMKARQTGDLRPRPTADIETGMAFVRSGFRHAFVDRATHQFEASTN